MPRMQPVPPTLAAADGRRMAQRFQIGFLGGGQNNHKKKNQNLVVLEMPLFSETPSVRLGRFAVCLGLGFFVIFGSSSPHDDDTSSIFEWKNHQKQSHPKTSKNKNVFLCRNDSTRT